MHLLFFALCIFMSPVIQAKSKTGFTLITSLYNEKNPIRMREYIVCLERNIEHPLIKEIVVLYDNSKDDSCNRLLEYLRIRQVKIHYISSRPTYGFCFDLANELYPHSTIILANADIFFNKTLHTLRRYDFKNKFLALTRWNLQANDKLVVESENGKDPFAFGQDVWIFQTPLKKFKDDFEMGRWGCDDAIAYWAVESGLTVLNPSMTIQCCHFHLSSIRSWIHDTPRYSVDEMCGVVPGTLDAESTLYPLLAEELATKNPSFLETVRELEKKRNESISN